MAREINLVPDIKNEMIKAIKMRNLIFFACLIIAGASIAVVAILGVTVGGQRLALDAKDKDLSTMSSKVNSYSDLSDFITIRDQVGKLSTIAENKNLLSRTFGILSAFLPTGADTITISELNINLSDSNPSLTFEAQANAGQPPYIDYNVLDAFKKSMPYMRYDYGDYVDKNGAIIPAYCMIENGSDGAVLSDTDKGIYAFWTINKEGCKAENDDNKYDTEAYEGESVVRIWRTPQFNEWFAKKYLTTNGEISGIEHFASKCIVYSGEESSGSAVKWSETNETCMLVPAGSDGIKITESSNGRDSTGELVLRFGATIQLAPQAYRFSAKHVLAFPPSGKHNVTDSYVQVQKMFSERAVDCGEDDVDCKGGA